MTKARNQWWTLYAFSYVCNNKELFVVVVSSFLGKVARRCRIFLCVSSCCQLPVANLAACRLFRTRSGKERLGNMGFMYEQFVDRTNAALKTKQHTNVPRIMLLRCGQNIAVRWQCFATCSNKKR